MSDAIVKVMREAWDASMRESYGKKDAREDAAWEAAGSSARRYMREQLARELRVRGLVNAAVTLEQLGESGKR